MSRDFTPLCILQITDTHLFADRHALLHGSNPHDSLQNLLQQVASEPRPDLLLLTGDLVHDGSVTGYRMLFEMLHGLDAPMGVIAGNHDDREALCASLPEGIRLGSVHTQGNWRIVLLNSPVTGEIHGHLDKAELQFLETALSTAGDRHVLVVLHHHPVPIGSAWMDRIALDNPDALFAALRRFPNVHAVLCGHVHQEFDAQRNGVRILATPSTCVQFLPRSPEFALDDKSPGVRWLSLHADGRIKTRVQRALPASRN